MISAWGDGKSTYIIAEIGLNHNGSVESARRLIDGAAAAGAHAVKFQKRDVANLAIRSVLDAPDGRFPSLGRTYRELRERHEFSLETFMELRDQATQHGLEFFATPFDVTSVDFLEEVGVSRFKVASHGVTNLPLLERIVETKKPVLLSTGMAHLHEVDEAVSVLSRGTDDLALLHCVSSYPTNPGEARLDLIPFLSKHFGLSVGYSGHEKGFLPTLAAISVGARIVERHLTLDNEMEGFDHRLSLTPGDFADMVAAIREVESMFGEGPKVITDSERITREKYQVSMVSARNLTAGTILSEEDVSFKNPGTGLTPSQAKAYFGRAVALDIPEDTIILPEMLEL